MEHFLVILPVQINTAFQCITFWITYFENTGEYTADTIAFGSLMDTENAVANIDSLFMSLIQTQNADN